MISESDTQRPKLLALTFDDGPDTVFTPRVLERLARHQVPASFFVIGNKITPETEPLLREMHAAGHEIQNHSWEHGHMGSWSAEAVRESVEKTSRAIEAAVGTAPTWFRAPYFDVSSVLYENIGLPDAGGYAARDWAGEGTDAEDRARLILAQAAPGAILLLHDVQPEPHPTPEALDILIPALKEQGYRFVTLTELFRQTGRQPRAGGHYSNAYDAPAAASR